MAVGGASAAACLIALIIALVAGGAVRAQVIPGLPDAGMLTRWGLPISKTVMDVTAALTLGVLLLAVVLLPSDRGVLGGQAQGYVRAASWAALVWAAAAAATLIFQLSDLLGLPPMEVIGNQLTSYAGSVAQGIALMLVILIATAVALLGRTVASATGTLGLLGLTLVGTVPPALTGHSSSSPNHELAVTGLALHVVAISVWVGGLAALTYHALRRDGEHLAPAAERFSLLALWSYVGVAVSGVASAASRLYSVTDLFTTSYGLIMVAKAVVFLVLGYLGWLHRRRTVPRIAEGAGRALFARVAAVEVVLMSVAMGLASALSRTAPPPPLEGTYDPVRELLGFSMPPEQSAWTLLTLWRPDLFFALLVVVLGGLYAAAVLRLRRRGDRWPWGRLVAWYAGLLTIVVVQLSGVATYAMVLFSTHMVQHMVLSMLTPILLVLGAPATLALRALKPAKRRGDRGPREWLTAFLHSRYSRFVTHPAFAVPMFVGSTYALYFTPLFGSLMSDHLGHLFMGVHFLLTGFLFYWIMIGVDPAPRKYPYLLRIVLLLLVMGFHAFFGIAIMMQSAPLGMEYYGRFEVPWLESVEDDQYTGGGIAWAIGEIPTTIVLIALVVQWSRDEERTERRRERHSRRGGSDDADMDAYNAYLQQLDRRSREQQG
ncbi:putative copper resistance protein D [Marinactinospora thermotolerans DSM 45154]|uniref:Putative copper resistance protein D n=2 Tax=Marinactinospora thermotolerans TaxID=531310 RepID=A0A1T4M8Z3_9ACTN|nr:cytochrome c oxidase assembly protein [Marinactinospora thermotolerans]SJZ63174.1 putative copper resistance protein D [Marinactinospora thermotolerans DSM 45154]